MKEFWISVLIAIAVVVAGLFWLAKASENYVDKHPEIAAEAKKSLEGYNTAVEQHNERIAKSKPAGK